MIVKDKGLGKLAMVGVTTKRILVVDDEASIRSVVSACLTRLGGWKVFTAASGLEALQQARAEMPDAIVLDVMMPEMDGFTFLRCLRAEPLIQNIPVVLLTANVYLPAPPVLCELGVVRIIHKPFQSVDLVPQIAQALGW